MVDKLLALETLSVGMLQFGLGWRSEAAHVDVLDRLGTALGYPGVFLYLGEGDSVFRLFLEEAADQVV